MIEAGNSATLARNYGQQRAAQLRSGIVAMSRRRSHFCRKMGKWEKAARERFPGGRSRTRGPIVALIKPDWHAS